LEEVLGTTFLTWILMAADNLIKLATLIYYVFPSTFPAGDIAVHIWFLRYYMLFFANTANADLHPVLVKRSWLREIDYIKLNLAQVSRSLGEKVEPLMMAVSIGVGPHVKIIFSLANHDYAIKVATLKHAIELNGALHIRLHSFDPLDLFDALSIAEHLFLHLLVQEQLHLERQSSRYLEIKIGSMPLVTAPQDVFVELKRVLWPPALVNHGQLSGLVEKMIQIKKVVFTVEN
jgi:hypothetical protein